MTPKKQSSPDLGTTISGVTGVMTTHALAIEAKRVAMTAATAFIVSDILLPFWVPSARFPAGVADDEKKVGIVRKRRSGSSVLIASGFFGGGVFDLR